VHAQVLCVISALAPGSVQQQPQAQDQLVQMNRRGNEVAAPLGQCSEEAPVRGMAAEEQDRHVRAAPAVQVGQDVVARAVGQDQAQQQDVWKRMPVAQTIERFPPSGRGHDAEPLARQGLAQVSAHGRVAVDHEDTW
jgi:hypothetical protein